MPTGRKLLLYQVTFAAKGEDGSYFLRFTTRRSKCDSKSWTDCDYLLTAKKPINCNATVHMNETHTVTKEVDCQIEDTAIREKAPCLGCPEDIDVESVDLKTHLSLAIDKYNSDSDHTHLFTLNEVGLATKQVVAGFRFKFTFDMRRSNCSKADFQDLHELCKADVDNVELANCNSTVDSATWRHLVPSVYNECEPGAMPTVWSRRRPPGFSPLRNILIDPYPQDPDSTSAPQPPAKASKSSGKEESSEEDTGLVSSDASPFHCPSKPWKPFLLATTGPATNPTPAEGTFSDLDLLG